MREERPKPAAQVGGQLGNHGYIPCVDERTRKAHEEAQEAGEDCYRDPSTGLWVLTANYLLERGYCCGAGCRHCPYEEEG